MSKMICRCGNIISDVVCPCPTEGTMIGQQSADKVDQEWTTKVAQFLEACRGGSREAWITRNLGEDYPTNSPDAEILDSILIFSQEPYLLSVAECDSCGRLHVQLAPGLNEYRSFAPDISGYHRLLRNVSSRD